ncbi:hypothetical protein C9374_011346 [Naegleria lovaniensis]|uniref:Transmembrane protein n=1 Tax=Naegleria lovaniensis TaxID=51637 RepID=A0AA88H4C3_NAELO|nr:uncharacterized protein C9374_011346 [Naegleria lovaniensis]KAG2392621.1 hypothetical protein C9374_011346 [Naegleria lovaniensis]
MKNHLARSGYISESNGESEEETSNPFDLNISIPSSSANNHHYGTTATTTRTNHDDPSNNNNNNSSSSTSLRQSKAYSSIYTSSHHTTLSSFTPRSNKIKTNENILYLVFEILASTSFLIYLLYGVFYYSFHTFAIPLDQDNSAHHYLLPLFFLLGGACVGGWMLSGFFLWKLKKLRSMKRYELNKCVSCSSLFSLCGLWSCLIPLFIAFVCTVIYIGFTIARPRDLASMIGCIFYGVISIVALVIVMTSSLGCTFSMKKMKKRNIPLLLFRKFRHAISVVCVVICVILFLVMFIYLIICGVIFSNLQLTTPSGGMELSVFTRILYFLEWMAFFACVAFGMIFFKQFPKITLFFILVPLLISALSFALSIVESNMMYNYVMDGAFRNLYGVFGDNNYILDQAVTLMAMIFFNVTSYFAYFKIKL